MASWRADTIARYDSENGTNGNGNGHPVSVTAELDAQPQGDQNMTQPLEQFKGKFGRYLDIDDDGIPYRSIPGTEVPWQPSRARRAKTARARGKGAVRLRPPRRISDLGLEFAD